MKKFLLSAAAIMMAASMMAINPAKFELKMMTGGEQTSVLPNEMAGCAMVFGDYDNDGDLDLFYVGGQNADRMYVGLLKNTGDGEFEAVELPDDFVALQQASAAWMDYNNDGNLDLIVVGTPDGTTTYTYVMKNLGADEGYAFEEDLDNYLPGVYGEGNDNVQHIIAPVDFDNDGWTDLVLNGNAGGKWDGEHGRMTALFKNVEGVFQFVDDKATIGAEVFAQVNGGGVTVADLNNDGYMDILVTGYDDDADKLPDGEGNIGKGNGASYVYMNNGNGGYSKLDMTFAAAENQGLLVAIDANNDGWLDIVEMGRDLNNGWANSANLYINDGTGKFAQAENHGLVGGQTVIGMGDMNNDGFMDFAHTGWPTVSIAYGKGDGTFDEVSFNVVTGLDQLSARGGATSVVDLNGDNTLDIHVSGWSDANGRWSDGIALNTVKDTLGADLPANAAPSAPKNVTVVKGNDGYTITWEAAEDDNTPAAALRYNIMAKAADGTAWMLVPADPETGKQKVAGLAPAYLHTLSYTFKGEGEYTFFVQAIDGANVGSTFATVGTGVDNINATELKVRKVVENGQVYIIKNNEKFTVLGQKVEL